MLKFDNCLIENGAFQLKADFQIMPLSSVAIIGPSGSGKSTLLEALAGFRSLTHGALLWKDQDLTSLHPGKRPIAMLFQDGNLFPHLTVFQNVALGMQANKRLTNEEVSQVEMALVRVGLADMGLRKPAELSGGQRSRVALARVLVQRRELLLLDEPFAALGPALKAEMLDLVADLAKETDTTVLMVSHDPNDARRIASQTVLVAEGVAHQPQATAELLDNPPAVLRDYLGGA
ncbi:ABC thiamine transporter, ATPase subunit [Rhodobacterales bacterium HTCC2150]|nr:ABC thiamine transporter, ATPase subunit [Rhodobacterales bacterium HTCC2150] [Rhodobacteraceae bacterium HTCC2150]